ncbi:hypothetical protein MMC25_001488 [Agyrium rufum]|nr:hypothetical protein [Agyrium rufum]
MATIVPSRPSTSGRGQSSSGGSNLNRQASLSSFPSARARTPSVSSLQNGISRMGVSTRTQRGGSGGSSQTPSTPSSQGQRSSGERFSPNASSRPARRVRSQYPADSGERHVEYILVASFHVDQGPIMEHQYPGAISGDENMLAELMLPDQAHVRNQDWTMFFLHKDTSEEDEHIEDGEGRRLSSRGKDATNGDHAHGETNGNGLTSKVSEEDPDDDGGEGPPLIYVLNLVNTKHDNTQKRGAVVRSMAICTRHSFLHIYKPLLLLALEEYFKVPTVETLELLYDAVNSMDLSLMPRISLLERYILQATDTKDLFIEKFEAMIQQRMASDAANNTLPSPETPSPQKSSSSSDPTSQRGHRYALPRDTHEYETRVIYNGIPIPIKVPTAISPETVGDFSIIKLIQTFSAPHAATPQPFHLHPHLTTAGAYTHPIIVLFNALLTQKRIIFLGHNRPSAEVAEAVLAACALASGGLLRGFTRHAFPYTDLSKKDDLLKVPGFLAGVTNPAFAFHQEGWDLLCELPTGRMKISSHIEPAPVNEGIKAFQQQHPSFAPNAQGILGANAGNSDPTGDNAFMDDVLRSIAARHGENAIRSKWRDYVTKFTRLAAAFEEGVYGASALYIGAAECDAPNPDLGVSGHGYVWPDEASRAKELGANLFRIEGWRLTRSYYSYIQDLAALWNRKPIRSLDLAHQHARLRLLKLSHEESGKIFLALCHAVRSYEEICQLLGVTPAGHAGLFYVTLGLVHPEKKVREAVAGLLERIRTCEAGKGAWAGVGGFAKMGFERVKRDMAADAAATDAD